MTELFYDVLGGFGFLVMGLIGLLLLLGLWYVAIKLASFAWSRGRKEAQNPHDWRSDGR
jgi:hypothetical protein